jgi:hypothetical protein
MKEIIFLKKQWIAIEVTALILAKAALRKSYIWLLNYNN